MKDEDGRVDSEAGIQSFIEKNPTGPRPVTFVIGGGPGTSSAYLNLGALGPWRISFNGPASAARSLLANTETWLDFTDLVFIDPPGLGYGLVLSRDAKVRERVWSVEGDIDLLSDAIASWLRANNRLAAPKLLVGQSYGGFRAPRMAEALHRRHGIALNGLILVSPILDYGWRFHARTSPLAFATLLPSFAAVRMESEESFIHLGSRRWRTMRVRPLLRIIAGLARLAGAVTIDRSRRRDHRSFGGRGVGGAGTCRRNPFRS